MNDNVFYDHELEKGFITSILSEPELFADVADQININSFHSEYCSEIFKKMQQDYLKDGDIKKTKIMLYSTNKFGQNKTEEVLDNKYFVPMELETIVDNLNDIRDRRQVKESLNKAYKYLKDTELEPDDFKSKVQDEIFNSTSKNLDKNLIHSVEDILMESFRRFHERQEGKTVEKIKTGFRSFDIMTGGLSRKHLSIIAGRPSMGKTAISLILLGKILETSNVPSLVFSMEMSREKLIDRMLIQKAQVCSDDYYASNKKSKLDLDKMSKADREVEEARRRILGKQTDSLDIARNWLLEKPLKVVEKRGLDINTIKSISRKADNLYDNKLGLIVIDYLTLIKISAVGGRLDKGYAGAARDLRDLSDELNCHVMLIHQINRDLKSRSNKRPRLSDLRDSGELEEAADLVGLVHRPEYYKSREEGIEEKLFQNDAEFIIAKNREGKTGTIPVNWYPEILTFQDHLDKRTYGKINYLKQ
ncbi:primary replicative DNA helicase [Halanaerobium congolense]|uniref:DNA 5'-3' helicase n=1 Tax=Halanaerobium congolense TaxID=54121 RepID=A0A1I0D9J4_9FIRM|nr:DnaB-like helicase C-terminal domain-containing protein [Halanaerobium congolense]PTX14561.1 replicative DNA helicase [Halanaerobium congolense]SDG21955.1 primary replicative DNA helicase [Halanaerobium congolense]SET28918.1 primary replicative DNA helicase [Halanaerobium congolense]SFP79650.1 primary replicative DNA helicase [Halanaerobium congolense]